MNALTQPKCALAPMATLTHEALRQLIHVYGDPDEYFSEMIHAPSFLHGGAFEAWYVRSAPVPEKMVWQLTGFSAEPMVEVARILQDYGGIGVDLNMGCSAPDIVRSGAGVAWMSKPVEEVAGLVRSVRAQVQGRLSVKCRLGETEDYARLLTFAQMLVSEGVNLITLHPRTRKQGYNRPAKREYVARLAQDIGIPVYGNGDIDCVNSADSFLKKVEKVEKVGSDLGRGIRSGERDQISVVGSDLGRGIRSGERDQISVVGSDLGRGIRSGEGDQICKKLDVLKKIAGVMIGRAAVQKPWIFAEYAQSKQAEPRSPIHIDHLYNIQFFLEQLQICQPQEFWPTRARRFFSYYCDNFTFNHHLKTQCLNATKKASPNADSLNSMFKEIEQAFVTYFDGNNERFMDVAPLV